MARRPGQWRPHAASHLQSAAARPGAPRSCLPRACSVRPGPALLGCRGASCGPSSGKGGVAGCFDLLSAGGRRRRPGRRASRGLGLAEARGSGGRVVPAGTHSFSWWAQAPRSSLPGRRVLRGRRRHAVGGLVEAGGLQGWWRHSPASQRGVLSLYSMTEQWRARAPEWPEGSAVETPGRAEAAAARGASRGRPTLHPASALAGYGPLGEALRSTRARGSGLRLSGHFSGKGLLSKWITPTPPGAGSGDPPPAANPLRNPL